MKIETYLKQMDERHASDLYFKVGSVPYFRIDDDLMPAAEGRLEVSDIDSIIDLILTDKQKRHFELTRESDGAYSIPGLGRFRFNIYIQRSTKAVTFRAIKKEIPSFAELNLPVDILQNIASQRRGLVLVTGHAGSGKSTTIASMIDYINRNFSRHIITVEDPIEFIHDDNKSIISQREVGTDTMSFDSALRHIIRQSPDIILIGEMRDAATMQTAITAADTGHLVLSTLHTVDAMQTVDRIINFFPAYTHNQIRMHLSQLLKGVVSMRLVPRSDKPGRVPACEIMVSTPTIKKYIAEGKTNRFMPLIEEGKLFGMCSFNQALAGWFKKAVISKETALNYASNPDELTLQLKDILSGKGNYTS
jgi:twitching motility protein PilT